MRALALVMISLLIRHEICQLLIKLMKCLKVGQSQSESKRLISKVERAEKPGFYVDNLLLMEVVIYLEGVILSMLPNV